MSPEDDRHGKYAGAIQHWLAGEKACDPCTRAGSRYRQERILRTLAGEPVTVPAIGTLRRIRALHALGWTGPQVAAEADLSVHTMRSIGYHGSASIHAATAAKINTAYERLCMTRPEGRYADRARAMARRRGWVPPLAFDDIDDPDETPSGWQYQPSTRRDQLEELVERGAGITEACTDLGIRRNSVEAWTRRHGCTHLYTALCSREDVMRTFHNQFTKPVLTKGSAA